MDSFIAFDKEHRYISGNGRSAFSDIIYIPPGYTALLSLYNMRNIVNIAKDDAGEFVLENKACAVIHKVSFEQGKDIHKELACGNRVNINDLIQDMLKKRRVFHEEVTQCGHSWSINPCNNFVLIPTPGFYRIEFFDINQLDTAYVEYFILSVADSATIPDDFKLGSK